jgi:hypothetical protein
LRHNLTYTLLPRYPHLRLAERLAGLIDQWQPWGICLYCQAKGCDRCYHSGWLSQCEYVEAKHFIQLEAPQAG